MHLVQIFSLLLPILLPGVFLITALKFKLLSAIYLPLDLNQKFGGKRLLGNNKTFLGLFIYLFGAILTCYLLSSFFNPILLHPIFSNNFLQIGLIYGLIYNFGEIINSFIKRRYGIQPGKSVNTFQYLIDLLDGFFGVALVLVLSGLVPFNDAFIAGIFGLTIHFSIEKLMVGLNLKQKVQ